MCFLEAKEQFSEKPIVSPLQLLWMSFSIMYLMAYVFFLISSAYLPTIFFLFHLGSLFFFRIALQENTNRMSANALAIVFAPCILRCPDTIDPLQSVQDISKTTT